MRNLKLLLHHKLSLVPGCSCMSVNSDTGEIYVATADGQLLAVDSNTGKVNSNLDVKTEDGINWIDNCKFESLQFLPDEQALCAATSAGDLLLWNLLSHQLENVGCVESGISVMSWSPDQELLVLVTGAGTFIMMTREFDPVSETSLYPEHSGEAEFVQVGWGKKETQFHGSAGKEAARVQKEEVRPVQPWDDRKARVTWREDGQYFAISVVHPNTGVRKVYVWTREGVHHSTSENVDGIEQALSWKPSGSLIATSQRRPNKHDIAFFERNGLRHGEFSLPFQANQVKVREVLWNSDSTVLLVWCEDLVQENNSKSYLQLWTMGNYHWYLKQSLQYDSGTDTLAAVVWDIEHVHRLHVLGRTGTYLQYTWAWGTNHSGLGTSRDDALVAVIDGAQVLMTPMRDMVVPPPMSAYQLTLPSPVNHVIFSPAHDIALVTATGEVALYSFSPGKTQGDSDNKIKGSKTGGFNGCKLDATGGPLFSQCCEVPTLKGIYMISDLPSDIKYPLAMSHHIWISSDCFIFFTVTMTTQPHSVLHKVKVTGDKMAIVSSTDVESCVFGVAFEPDSHTVAVQLNDGTILKYLPDDDMLLPWELLSGDQLRFPVPCIQMEMCYMGQELAVIGLTERYRLYVNDVEVASNCTSFCVHDEFLLLTTLAHTCRCINRHTKIRDLPTLSDGKAHPFDESIRRVERGSRIVVAVRGHTQLVLQMPRGNLETIHPRALVLSAIRSHLDKLHFKEAFILMRQHRVNMNLLYDHNPDLFMDNVGLFVQEITDVNHINLFLTDLVEEDVTVTMYTAAYQRYKEEEVMTQRQTAGAGKVDKVCDAVRQTLEQSNKNKYLLSILTTYVRKTQPELELALQLVKHLRDAGTDMPHISAEEALKYLLFLVDVNELYDIALGTYDFDLVLMVAEKSQKDPKEYIPFLNELRKMETNYQHFTIDKYLKRFSKALVSISKCGDERFGECKALINEHRLHCEALQLYQPGSSHYKDIASSYGDMLSGKRRHEEAAVMYAKGENWEKALQSYMSASDWRQTLCMAAILKYSPEQELEMARKLAEELQSRNRYGEAAVVLEQYVKDVEEAIVTLIKGGLWDEALRIMYKYNRADFIETDLKPHLLETVDGHMSTLAQNQDTFKSHLARLIVVRQEKEKAKLELLESGGMGVQDSDLFSDTSSATGISVQSSQYSATSASSSIYSKMSGRSLKNQRKAEHKKWRLKEGSEFEDFALISAMAKIIQYTDSLRDEMKLLLRTLVRFHYDSQAFALQRLYDSILSVINTAIPQIWLDEEEQEKEKPVFGPNTTANTIALALQKGRGGLGGEEDREKLDPVIRLAPVVHKDVKWKLYALES